MFLAAPYLWRGGLPPLGREAAPKPDNSFWLTYRIHLLYDCFAAERGQAPSPQASPLTTGKWSWPQIVIRFEQFLSSP